MAADLPGKNSDMRTEIGDISLSVEVPEGSALQLTPIPRVLIDDTAIVTSGEAEQQRLGNVVAPLAGARPSLTPVPGAELDEEETIELTPRQQRVLRYLARRHMRNVRIVKRPPAQDGRSGIEEASGQRIVEVSRLRTQPLHRKDTPVPAPAPTLSTPIPDALVVPNTPIPDSLVVPVVDEQAQVAGIGRSPNATPEPPGPHPGRVSPGHGQPLPYTSDPPILAVERELGRGRFIAPTADLSAPRARPGGVGIGERPGWGQAVAVRPVTVRSVSIQTDHPHAALVVDRRRKRRHRKVMLRHLSRKHLRLARAREQRAHRQLWMTIASTVLSMLVVLLSLGSAGAVVAYNFVHSTQKTFDHRLLTLQDLLPPDNLKIFDSKGVIIDQLADNGIHTTVKFDAIAPDLIDATVATEDKDFWHNQGIDTLGIIRAALTNLQNGRVVEGGSTITQQLIKNLVVGNGSTYIRKLEEIILAPQLNSRYSKRDILEMYLNSIYYGHQAYGVDAAATVYFGLQDESGRTAAQQLDLAQSAMLAGLPSNPSEYDPSVRFAAATLHFEAVLNLMVSQRYITRVQALDAFHEEQSPHFFRTGVALQNRAPHFTDFVLAQLQAMFHLKRSELSRSGMVVYTTLDIGLQDRIQKIAQQHIAELRAAHHLTNAAEVLIDFHTGAIISLLGSIDYNNASIDGQFDVTTAYRQPGSSFKPYVYVTAFEQGYSPAQAIDDAPITINIPDSNPPVFSPSNYDLHFHGHMTLRCALQNSLNVPAVRVLEHVGIDAAMQTAYKMGITSYQGLPGYSLVLGGLGIRLIDHTSAMGVFANAGVRVPYYAINKVVAGSTGKVLFQHQRDPGKQVISPQLAYMMTNVLSDNTSRIPEFYDCNVLQLYANSQQDCWYGNRGVVRPAAAKTGTTQNFRDNWTVGYTTDFVMGVWAGNDDNTPMYNVTGVQGAAPIWHDSMLLAEQGHPIRDFVNPGGLVRGTVTYPDGVQTTDWFLPGTVPTFAPTPTPTPPPDGSPTPTLGSPTPTPSPGPGGGNPAGPTPTPYCPNSYSFAFAPPADDGSLSDPGWW